MLNNDDVRNVLQKINPCSSELLLSSHSMGCRSINLRSSELLAREVKRSLVVRIW